MTWRSSLPYLWKAARAGIARLDRLLAETGNSDEDMIFYVRDAGDEWRSKDLGRGAVDPGKTMNAIQDPC
jgi:LPS sulfotransferase NodH